MRIESRHRPEMKEEKGEEGVGIFDKFSVREKELYDEHQKSLERIKNLSVEEAKSILSDSYEERKNADNIKRKQEKAVEEIENIAIELPDATVVDGFKTPRFDMALKIALLGKEVARKLLEKVSDHQIELSEANFASHLGYTKSENAFLSIQNAIESGAIKGDMKINGLIFSKWDQNKDNPFRGFVTRTAGAISPDVIKMIEEGDYNVKNMFDAHLESMMFMDEPGRLDNSSTNIILDTKNRVEGAIKQMRALGFEEEANTWEAKAREVFKDAKNPADQL